MRRSQWRGIIIFLSLPTVVFAITSLFYRSVAYNNENIGISMKAMEYSLLTWMGLIIIGISFICWLLEED